MKVEVNRISSSGLELREDIPASSWDMDREDVKFLDNIHLCCRFRRVSSRILADCRVETVQLISCGRCLSEVEKNTIQEVKFSYNVADLQDFFEIDQAVREEVLLSFPGKVLCKPDCRGLCPGCGVNLNAEKCCCP